MNEDLNKNENTEHPAHRKMRAWIEELRAQGVEVNTEPREGLTVIFNPPQSWIDDFRAQKERDKNKK